MKPRRNIYRPATPSLPEVVEQPIMDETMSEFVMTSGNEYCWDNPACWKMAFTCQYRGGGTDSKPQVRSVIAATRERAIHVLRSIMAGFGIEKILLHRAKGPLTPPEIARIRDLNAELEQIKKATPWVDPPAQKP